MILFKKYHVPLILDGIKTITRRGGSKRWNEGAFHQFTTNRFKNNDVFAGALIEHVYQERLQDISQEHVIREGYQTRDEYFDAFRKINHLKEWDPAILVWVVEFKVQGLMEVVERGEIKALLEYDSRTLRTVRFNAKCTLRAVNLPVTEKFTS